MSSKLTECQFLVELPEQISSLLKSRVDSAVGWPAVGATWFGYCCVHPTISKLKYSHLRATRAQWLSAIIKHRVQMLGQPLFWRQTGDVLIKAKLQMTIHSGVVGGGENNLKPKNAIMRLY